MGVGVQLLLFALTISSSVAQEWDFKELENPIPELTYGPTPLGKIIYLDEEVPASDDDPVYIIEIDYSGALKPSISFDSGVPIYLGAKIIEDTNKKLFFVITKKQDYENEDSQKYTVVVTIGSVQKRLFFNIINIDDNRPVVEIPPCEVPELYLGDTNCTYKVYDADGPLSIDIMKMEIEPRPGEVILFEAVGSKVDDYNINGILKTIAQLDFAVSQVHIFTLKAIDNSPGPGTATATVQVIDVPNMPPFWTTIFAIQRFPEKSVQSFRVKALDGDTGINKEINYRLKAIDEKIKDSVSIDEETGIISVQKIDRDALKQEVFSLDISAYKFDNISWETEANIVFIIDDINDNEPEVNEIEFSVTIPEETYLSLNLLPIINDIDLGNNAQYDVELISINPPSAKDAFLIIPDSGYQEQEFQITIINASLLDYDTPEWQIVKLEIRATEVANTSHQGSALVTINLENWNDEIPIFVNDSVTETILETEGKGYLITTMKATDRDIDDRLEYSLVGAVNRFLAIDQDTGEVTVAIDDAFDYQRQSEIIVQVLVEDTLGEPYHKVYAQLTIILIDVNNKPPEIRLPRDTPEIKEHEPDGTLITDEIQGSDPDSDAIIKFSINWEDSYAIKQGRRADKASYEGCVAIETIYKEEGNQREAIAKLTAKTMENGDTIDFEKFESLFLVIRLTDEMQEIGEGVTESTISIKIIDINDNPPTWFGDTLTVRRFVREEADTDIVIGTIQAIDIDGPDFNEITYSIKPINDTPPNLVKINPNSGQIVVDAAKAIDADIPKRYYLYYNVTASDCTPISEPDCYDTEDPIKIDITDTNNKDPFALEEEYNSTIYVYENETTGFEIVRILSYDYDRDDAYSKVVYRIDYTSYPELRKYFSVNLTTGMVIVDLQDDSELDRDNPDTATHDIFLILSDNFDLEGDRVVRENRTSVYVILLDVNDNAPQLPPSNTYRWTLSENTAKGFELEERVVAPDIDEEDTDNSRVQYEVLSVTVTNPLGAERPIDLFDILSPDNVSGIVITNYDMKGYWGTYDIWLKAFDLGVPSLSTNETYVITVTPYNYEAPNIIFPKNDSLIRLAKENAAPGGTLYTAKGDPLEFFSAEDSDGLEAGEVDFEVFGDDQALEYFEIAPIEDNKGKLLLKKNLDGENSSFKLIIKAVDRGIDPGPKQSINVVTIVFVSTQGQPVYDEKVQVVKFTEFAAGRDELMFLENATDPRNLDCVDDECVPVYYHIIDGNQRNLFVLNMSSNVLFLNEELNRTETPEHKIRVAATNFDEAPGTVTNPDSILEVTVQVREADPKPVFTKSIYTAGIATSDDSGKLLFTLEANHTEELPIRFSIKEGSMEISDNSLSDVKDRAFVLKESGELTLEFRPTNNMKGIFTFKVLATDTSNKMDEAECKIFLIADNNKVSFIFDNDLRKVEQERDFIASTFSTNFKLICNIDTLRVADDNGVQIANQTEVITHFIDPETNLAVEAKEVEDQKSNILLMGALQRDFAARDLTLSGFTSTNPESNGDSLAKTLQIILIVVSTVLGALCIVLLVAYCIRTRSLNNRLKALSVTKFGSQTSDMNRIGVAVVPGTNKHAIEGSNPVWNEEIKTPQFDGVSVTSGDSDLIGIEESEQFSYNPKQKDKF